MKELVSNRVDEIRQKRSLLYISINLEHQTLFKGGRSYNANKKYI